MNEERIATGIAKNPVDQFLTKLIDLMEGEKAVPNSTSNSAADVEAQRKKQLQKLFDGVECVDLVGHSTPINRYLKLGDWELNPKEAERLASYMPASVKTVRLIGCKTASTELGLKAVQALSRRGLSAAGTMNNVYMTHFDKHGVRRDAGAPGVKQLPPSGERPTLAPVPSATNASSPTSRPPVMQTSSPPMVRTHAPGLTARLRAKLLVSRPLVWFMRCALWVITIPFVVYVRLFRGLAARRGVPHRRILWLLSSRSTLMPGLLTEPLLTFEITSKQKTWTLEILFDFEYARFYSSTDSRAKRERVYKIRRGLRRITRTVLEKYLQYTPDGVVLTGSHEEARQRGWPAPSR